MTHTAHPASGLSATGHPDDLLDLLLNSIPAPSVPGRLIGILLLLIIVLIAGWLAWDAAAGAWRRRTRPRGPFKSRNILTPNEIEFYNRLVSALPGYVVLSQVSMSAIIEPRTDDPQEYMRRRMKFAQKYVDFIVCEPGDLRIICIVELDDITHDEAKDAARDEMLNGAGYEVVRWHSRNKPDRAAIAKTIRRLDQEQK